MEIQRKFYVYVCVGSSDFTKVKEQTIVVFSEGDVRIVWSAGELGPLSCSQGNLLSEQTFHSIFLQGSGRKNYTLAHLGDTLIPSLDDLRSARDKILRRLGCS